MIKTQEKQIQKKHKRNLTQTTEADQIKSMKIYLFKAKRETQSSTAVNALSAATNVLNALNNFKFYTNGIATLTGLTGASILSQTTPTIAGTGVALSKEKTATITGFTFMTCGFVYGVCNPTSEMTGTLLTSQIREMDKFTSYQMIHTCGNTEPYAFEFSITNLVNATDYTLAFFGTAEDPRNTSISSSVLQFNFKSETQSFARIIVALFKILIVFCCVFAVIY